METHNTSITHWQRVISRPGQFRWQLMKYNEVFHLYDLGSAIRIPWATLRAQQASADDQPAGSLETEQRPEEGKEL